MPLGRMGEFQVTFEVVLDIVFISTTSTTPGAGE